MSILFLVLAGALGAVSRYALGGLAHNILGNSFPYGTLIVNVIGSLLIGFIMQISLSTDMVSPQMRTIIIIGFPGAFTTFPAFSYETAGLLEDGSMVAASINIVANVALSLVAVFLGIGLGRMAVGG